MGIKSYFDKYIFVLFNVLILLGIFIISRYNYLLFHTFVELFSVVISVSIFVISWNSKQYIKNNFLLIIGVSFLFVGIFDLLHALSYKGMGVFSDNSANLATQLWLSARFIQSISLLATFLFFRQKINSHLLFIIYSMATVFLLISIFYLRIFPLCYIENIGLTKFKIISEYFICLIFLVSLILLGARKKEFDSSTFYLLFSSIILKVLGELTFSLYIDVYGVLNEIGHFLKIGAFYLIYLAIIKNGLNKPFNLLFRELARTKTRYQDLVENIQDGIIVLDKNFKITFVNPRLLIILNYNLKDVLNKEIFKFITFKKKIVVEKINNLKNGTIIEDEFILLTKDKKKVLTNFEIREIKDKNKVQSLIITIQDLTLIKEKEKTLIKDKELAETLLNESTSMLIYAEKELAKAKRLSDIGTLAASIAHELRNPLGVIQIAAYNIRKKSQNPILDNHLDNIEKKVSESAKIIDNLLNYSKIKMPVFDDVNIYQLLLDSLKTSISLFKTDDIAISVNLDSIKNVIIKGDAFQLKEIFINIINNSFQAFTDNKGKISVYADINEYKFIEISIKDNGSGIDKEDLEFVFKPFFTKKSKGTGLGLAICSELVELHEGKISIHSKLWKGTTVIVSLPLKE